jgi:hypothetical protein
MKRWHMSDWHVHTMINVVTNYGEPKLYGRAPDNFQVQRVITPYFWKWWVIAYFLCTVVLSTSEKIAYMYTFKIMFDTSVIQ